MAERIEQYTDLDSITRICPCGSYVMASGNDYEELDEWMVEHLPHTDGTGVVEEFVTRDGERALGASHGLRRGEKPTRLIEEIDQAKINAVVAEWVKSARAVPLQPGQQHELTLTVDWRSAWSSSRRFCMKGR